MEGGTNTEDLTARFYRRLPFISGRIYYHVSFISGRINYHVAFITKSHLSPKDDTCLFPSSPSMVFFISSSSFLLPFLFQVSF